MSSTVEKPTPGHTPDGDQAHRPPGDQSGNTIQPTAPAKKSHKRLFILGAGAILVLLLVWTMSGWFGTVSTDDAYVNSHVTFVAPRVAGQVAKVLVDDNNRVRKGDVLVELDPEPFQVQVDLKQSAVASADADLIATQASVRASIAQARSGRFNLQHTIESVDNQIALLHANAAAFEKAKATLTLAQTEFDRYKQLLSSKVASREEYDQHVESLDVAKAENNQAMENVTQSRVALGLPPMPDKGRGIADTPSDLDQTFSAVRQAEASLMQSAAQLGVVPSSFDLKPQELLDEFLSRDPDKNIDRIYAKIMTDAPALKQAQTKLEVAKNDLDQAKLNLRYCKIVSEIDGVVTRRNVNPGNDVQVGQSLMAVRSLTEIWIDANFKETQLGDLRIGLPVDLRLDMYGKRHAFKGRISGFTMGTGSTLALLPPENATGNFIKVVQRLPVRIELVNYNPDKDPLFVGLSVEPTVQIHATPTGPNAGQYLQPHLQGLEQATDAPQPAEAPKSAAAP